MSHFAGCQQLTSTLDIAQVYERFSSEVKKLVDFDRMAINTIDYATQTFTIKYLHGSDRPGRSIGVPVPLQDTGTGQVVVTGQAFVRDYVSTDSSLPSDQIYAKMGTRSGITMPLLSNNIVIGTISLRHRQPQFFGARQQAILERLARQIAPAVENAQIYDQARAEMAVVDEVAQIMTATLDINESYEQFASELKKLVDFDHANINVIERDGDSFLSKYISGEGHPELGYVGSPQFLEGSQTGHVAITRQTLVRPNIWDDYDFSGDVIIREAGFQTSIAVPLLCKGRVIGVIRLLSRTLAAYGPREQAILEGLANLIAPAVDNATLYEQVTKEISVVDEVAQILTSTLDVAQAYDQFVREMGRLVPFDSAAICLVNQADHLLVFEYVYGPLWGDRPVGSTRPLEGTWTQEVLAIGHTMQTDDTVESQIGSDPAAAALGLHSFILVPLFCKGQVMGTIGLRSHQIGAYGLRERAILERLASQIAPAVENARLYELQQQAERASRENEERYRDLYQNAPITYYSIGTDGKVLRCNQHALDLLGYNYDEFVGKPIFDVYPDTPEGKEKAQEIFQRFTSGESINNEEAQMQRKDGTLIWINLTIHPVRDEASGEVIESRSIVVDITQRKLLEAQFLQSQKMETVGRLAGGVAHDFNNLLTAILGYSQMLLQNELPEGNAANHIQEIQKAAERAASLTNQLLAFFRNQAIEPQVVDLNDLILNLNQMFRRLIGEDIELVTLPASELASVKIDPGQIEQVLMNLVVNARDAMPQGGKLTIETSNFTPDTELPPRIPLTESTQFITFTVGDTGVGISKEVQEHIFEPSFTTKEVGKGTGLGLATCYGIVQQSGGDIEVFSEPGAGTRFRVYLPATTELPQPKPEAREPEVMPQGSERILLAEDEPLVWDMVSLALRDQGYQVWAAANGDEALRMVEKQTKDYFHILIIDVVMPTVSGPELVAQIRMTRPDMKVLYTSGYTEGANFHRDQLDSSTEFLQNPYHPNKVVLMVREILDR